MKVKRVGVLGSGGVGQALAKGFASRGCEVKIGSREAKDDIVSFADAAQHGEMVVLATRWDGTENALRLAGHENLAGKVLIDVTNPLEYRDGRPVGLAIGHTDSGGEQVQRWVPEAKVVKAFNTVGNALMVDPNLAGGPPDMFIAGNDEDARAQVAEICKDFGWGVADMGDLTAARVLEPMCWAWVTYGARHNVWTHAFKLLRR